MPSSVPPSAAVVATIALLVAASAAAVVPVAADARLTITDTTVGPSTPTAGAPLTVTATVRLSGGSDTPLSLDTVAIEDADGAVLDRATGLGRLSPGETLSVPVTVTLAEPGAHELLVRVTGDDEEGQTVAATRPLTVGVERGEPLIELRTDGLAAGVDTPVEAVVSNPTAGPLRDLVVRVTAPAGGDRTRRTVPVLAAGATATLNFSVRPDRAAGTTTDLTVRANYTEPTGTEATAAFARRVAVEPVRDNVTVRVGPTSTADEEPVPSDLSGIVGGDGTLGDESAAESESRPGVTVTVANAGNAPIDDVVIAAETPDGTPLRAVGRFPVGRLAPGGSATAQADLAAAAGVGAVRFVAAYDLGGERRRSVVTYRDLPTAGNATFTGVNVGRDRDRITIEGNLANTGDAEIRGAVVSVRPTAHVEPAYPRRRYFVGTVAGSEFVPFNLTARADVANATAVSVAVTYVAGGDRTAETVAVPLPENGAADVGSGTAPGVAPFLLGGAVVGLVVIPLAVYRRRR